jgi:hypothetical protein
MKIDERLPINEKIKLFVDLFPTISKEEADYIARVLNWHAETRAAFLMAKTMFDDHVKQLDIDAS